MWFHAVSWNEVPQTQPFVSRETNGLGVSQVSETANIVGKVSDEPSITNQHQDI